MERIRRQFTGLLQTITTTTRDKEGYPLDGSVDVVPGRPHLREQLASVMRLLQSANARNEQLSHSLSRWKTDYANLRANFFTLKYGKLCSTCQLQRLSMRDGEGHEVTCSQCRKKETGLQKLLEEAEDKARYWQRCYESLLAVHYGEGNDDGPDVGLQ